MIITHDQQTQPELERVFTNPERFSAWQQSTPTDLVAYKYAYVENTAPARPVSAAFTASQSFFYWPQELLSRWVGLELAAQKAKPCVALLATPVFWQLGPVFYQTLRPLGVPVTVSDPRNTDIIIAFIEQGLVDFVVTTQATALLLIDRLGSRAKDITWFIVVSLTEVVLLQQPAQVVEYHVFPGRPVGVAESNNIQTVDQYLYEIDADGECLLTDLQERAMSLTRLKLPGRYAVTDAEILTKLS